MKGLITLIRVILIGIWGVVLAVSIRFYADDATVPQMGGYAPWTVADSSMEPSYAKGDLVIFKMRAEAQPGDAVLYRGENGLAFSRIIGTSDYQFILKADGSEESILIEDYDVDGVCVTYLPGCGAAAEFLQSLPGIIVIIVAGLALIILPSLSFRKGKGGGGGPQEPAEPVQAAARRTPSGRSARRTGTGQDRYKPRH